MVDEMIREILPQTADTLKQEKQKTNNNKQVFKIFLFWKNLKFIERLQK